MTTETKNLMDGLLDEMNRVRELISEYKSLPGGVGFIGASLMEIEIKKAEKSISSGDVVAMLVCYQSLKDCTG